MIKLEGDLLVLDLDCHKCPHLGSLLDEHCRICLFTKLGENKMVQRVVLRKVYHRIYATTRLSELSSHIFSHDLRPDELQRVLRHPHDTRMLKELGLNDIKSLVEQWGLTARNYEEVFGCSVKPFFVKGYWTGSRYPLRLLETYRLRGRGRVLIYEQIGSPNPFYVLDLPEFKLHPSLVKLMYRVFSEEIKEIPRELDVSKSENVAKFLEKFYFKRMCELSNFPREVLSFASKILVNWSRYGVFEPLSQDDFLTDFIVESPPELQPLIVEHLKWGRCETGIYLSKPEVEGIVEWLASREGKRFDDYHPHLDAELPELGLRFFASRIAALSVIVRKRRNKPWTQPLFIEFGTLSPLASAFLSTVLRLGASAVILGGMGTAKTSQVETYIPEIGKGHRIVLFQDTEELHVQDFLLEGYRLTDVRIKNPSEMEKVVEAFLRGGAAYWLFTEVRQREAIKPAICAVARQGQPVILSMHARSTDELLVILTEQMGLSESEVKFIDLLVTCSKFETKRGVIRRITEICELRKDGSVVRLFTDNRKEDRLESRILRGNQSILAKLNDKSLNLSPEEIIRNVELTPPEEGGSLILEQVTRRLGIEESYVLEKLISEACMKSALVALAAERGMWCLELPFVTAAYSYYFKVDQDFSRWKEWVYG